MRTTAPSREDLKAQVEHQAKVIERLKQRITDLERELARYKGSEL